MLTFLRKIRKSLIESGSVQKYLLYAIGEIALVVIGILIALQINNWNEGQKDKKNEVTILQSIKSDMLKDVDDLNQVQSSYERRLGNFTRIDPGFQLIFNIDSSRLDTSHLIDYRIFNLPRSYRANTSSYDAMISEGQSKLVKNKELFGEIQRIYKRFIPAHLGIYENLRERQSQVSWKWSDIKRYKPYAYIKDIDNPEFIADLNFFYDGMEFYYNRLVFFEARLVEVIEMIEDEVSH